MSTSPGGARIPAYRLHKQSGQAIVTLNYGAGVRKDVPLGAHGSAASRSKYDRIAAEWLARGRVPEPAALATAGITVEELIARYWSGRVVSYYRHPDGSPTTTAAGPANGLSK